MSLTRIDCHHFRGKSAALDTSSYITLNPSRRAGSLVIAGSVAARESIGSQVACKLGLEHFVDGVLEFYSNGPATSSQGNTAIESNRSEICLEVLEAAFRNANSSVYNFGHKLAAGGRLSASLIGVVIEDQFIAAGRVGEGAVYLGRGGEILPFFEQSQLQGSTNRVSEAFIGSNSMVSVELASIPALEGDKVIVLPQELDQDKQHRLRELLYAKRDTKNPSELIGGVLFSDAFRVPFVIYASIGPETIYLAEAV